jgi:putative spermidine/putrescine transport system permease protein
VSTTPAGTAGAQPVQAGRRPVLSSRRLAWTGTLPFLGYVGLFLLLPTGIVLWDSIHSSSGELDFGAVTTIWNAANRPYFVNSAELSGVSAAVGALLGAVLAYAIASGNPDGFVRRLYLSASGVLAQFGGVTLAFAFLITIGPTSGLLFHAGWFYDFPQGIGLIYIYFEIPLMVLVFLPAIDGLKVQWREATETLGGSTWQFWRYVGGPLLAPAFLGATLLLFANALSAFATIVAWENQISYVVPQQIGTALSSEVGLSSANEADVLALGLIVLVAVVMTAYVLLQRRAARWLR